MRIEHFWKQGKAHDLPIQTAFSALSSMHPDKNEGTYKVH